MADIERKRYLVVNFRKEDDGSDFREEQQFTSIFEARRFIAHLHQRVGPVVQGGGVMADRFHFVVEPPARPLEPASAQSIEEYRVLDIAVREAKQAYAAWRRDAVDVLLTQLGHHTDLEDVKAVLSDVINLLKDEWS